MADFVPSPEQDAVLKHVAGKHGRLLAGPGTGKSATVIEWISRNSSHRAKLLTFTRAATAELVEKLSKRDNIQLDKPSTIHSFCIAVLLSNGNIGDFPRPFRMADDWETDMIVQTTLSDRLHIRKNEVNELFKELAANWESLNPEQNPKISAQVRARFTGGWREHREVMGYSLLSELPYALRSALNDHNDLKGIDHQTLVVDEYQDLNACDLEVLRLIANKGCSIIAAGDDDQSIYSFRKAHPAGIQQFLQMYPGALNYPLTITRRCGKKVVEWANYVIQGDPARSAAKQALRASDMAPDGEVALLSFAGHKAEAKGIANLAQYLISKQVIPPSEILILLRSDHNGQFSRPIKDELKLLNIPFSDPNEVKKLLADTTNRKALCLMRIAVNREDSLAWASLLELTPGIGKTFFNYIYERARDSRTTFGGGLLTARASDFPDLSDSLKRKAKIFVDTNITTVNSITVPDKTPDGGWGTFISSCNGLNITDEFRTLLGKIDDRSEEGQSFDRYLGQMSPIAKDIAVEKKEAVRIMTLSSSKGLTVKATIIAGLEQGLIPMDECDLAEERRLLYVGMTRAEQFLFGTWAQMRRGPTARAGRQQVNVRRQLSTFVEGGPVQSTDGNAYLKNAMKTEEK